MVEERRDDWKHGVNETLVSLTSAQRSTDKELDDLDLKYEAIDRVIRGDPQQDTDGIIARLHRQENALLEFRAELKPQLKDIKDEIAALRVDVKEKFVPRLEKLESNSGLRSVKWQTWGLIAATTITTGGLILTNLQKIKEAFQPKPVHYQPSKELLREIQRDKERHRKQKTQARIVPKQAFLQNTQDLENRLSGTTPEIQRISEARNSE